MKNFADDLVESNIPLRLAELTPEHFEPNTFRELAVAEENR
jgi:hypothetical protein